MKPKKSKHVGNSWIMPIIKFVLLSILLTVCAAVAYFLIMLILLENRSEHNCQVYLSQPIPDEVETYVCEAQLVPRSIGVCSFEGNSITRAEVGDIFYENIQPDTDTFADVNGKFGQFVTYCEGEIARQTNSEYSCTYDLTASGPRVSVIFNSTTDVVSDVRASGCGSGS